MFSLRRAALRVLVSPPFASSKVVSSSRPITTSSHSLLLQPRPLTALRYQRRFVSDDVKKADTERGPPDETEAVDSAVESARSADVARTLAEEDRAAEVATEPITVVDSEQDGDAVASASAAARESGLPASQVAQQAEPSNSIYIGNITFDTTEDDLKRELSRYGEVESTKIIYDGRGLSKGFGYVTMDSTESATAAIDNLHQRLLEGRRVVVAYANRKKGYKSLTKFTPRGEPTKTLFIGNMPYEMTDEDLNGLFRDIRNVIDVRVAIDRKTGKPRGFAHADFIDAESAAEAAKILVNKELYGRNLRLDYTEANRSRAAPAEED